jgi:hypothetical protein
MVAIRTEWNLAAKEFLQQSHPYDPSQLQGEPVARY